MRFASLLVLFTCACDEPFVLENRFPRWLEFAGDCGVRTDGVLACARLVTPRDDDEPNYLVYQKREGSPALRTLASGSAGRDGCALTTAGDIYCYGANEEMAQPESAPFTALALRRNGLALCALREDGGLRCASSNAALSSAVEAAQTTTFSSLGGFVGNLFYALDEAGVAQGFGPPGEVPTLVSPVALSQLSCEEAGCAALGQDNSLICFSSTGQAQRYAVDTYSKVIRLPTGCCGLRELGDVVCINPPEEPAQPREYSQTRFATLHYVPGLGVCGATLAGAGACSAMQ